MNDTQTVMYNVFILEVGTICALSFFVGNLLVFLASFVLSMELAEAQQ